jgi:hypothetical protein
VKLKDIFGTNKISNNLLKHITTLCFINIEVGFYILYLSNILLLLYGVQELKACMVVGGWNTSMD